ncbi:hypothetical protein ACIHIX_34780 [Streptomyces sp. NPDC051913]
MARFQSWNMLLAVARQVTNTGIADALHISLSTGSLRIWPA